MAHGDHTPRETWDMRADDSSVRSARRGGLRVETRLLLRATVVASLLCMLIRSLQAQDPLGLLVWPVCAGFGVERLAGGHGVAGATLGGLVSTHGLQVFGSPLIGLVVGACWGFYLGVWIYIVVETVLQWL